MLDLISTLALRPLSAARRYFRWATYGVLGSSLWLGACSSPSALEESRTLPPTKPAAKVAVAAPVRLAYFYSGTLAGKLRVHLYLLPEGHARLYGQYRYEGRTGAIGLVGQHRADGQLVLREYADDAAPQRATAEFRLAPQADGSLAGTWHVLSQGKPRQLAVVLRPEAPPAPGCQTPIITNLTSDVPIITVPDTAATQMLRAQLNAMLSSDEGDPGTMSWVVDYAADCLLSLNVTSEMQDASVTQGNQRYVVDLRTGAPVTIAAELLPARCAALQAQANQRLQHRIEAFISEWNRNNDPFPPEDAAGLRAQRLALRQATNPTAYLAGDSVYFPLEVAYPDMSNFLSKAYHDNFAPAFSFEEIQPYLLPASPLRRLARRPAR